jgi:molybdopterin/thiamine biosynthesis adenylyltransferase/rhodanese-related sulfurtransferase
MADTRPAGHGMEVEPEVVHRDQADGVTLLDVRSAQERLTGVPEGSVEAGPDLDAALARYGIDRAAKLYLICARGVRSLRLAAELRSRGYGAAASVRGGFAAWLERGLPAKFAGGLDAAEAARYARHLVLPQIGPGGQRLLLDAAVLLVGAGGLSSPAGQYLAAAGVGRLGIVDFDVVERSNLQRQVLHDDASVGLPKANSAAERLRALNPDIEVRPIPTRLERDNVEEVLEGWDVVVDGTDNFPTRYLVNDACVKLGLPLVYGAVMQFEGQLSVFWPAAERGVNPCYRCLFPEPPPLSEAPDCETAGVLGVLPGIVGALQAAEALKLLLGIGEPLVGRLLRIEALSMRFASGLLRADPQCPLCAPGAKFPGYPDYEEFCSA